jgi:transcriptional regulator with XRE-family HTH domain
MPRYVTNSPPTREARRPAELRKLEFARRLQAAMVAKGVSQSELGRATGIGRDSISHYVRGVATPSPMRLKAMGEALGVAGADLFPAAALGEDEVAPAMEARQTAEGRVFVRINQPMSMAKFVRIAAILQEREESDG